MIQGYSGQEKHRMEAPRLDSQSAPEPVQFWRFAGSVARYLDIAYRVLSKLALPLLGPTHGACQHGGASSFMSTLCNRTIP